jgi:hypothetical protein
MQKIILLTLLCLGIAFNSTAQNNKIYVSKHGGTKKLLTFGKTGYNHYRFTNNSKLCDTLICSGSGNEKCTIDRGIIELSEENAVNYKLYNAAMKSVTKHCRKSKKSEGGFNFYEGDKTLVIKYKNADRKGNADIEISVIQLF